MDKVFGITLDNASANIKFLDLLNSRTSFMAGRGFRCLAHIINLVCQTLMGDEHTAKVANKIRAIARYVGAQGSAQRMDAWMDKCRRVLALDTKTRWGSTKEMLEVALGLKEKMEAWRRGLDKNEGKKALYLSAVLASDSTWRLRVLASDTG